MSLFSRLTNADTAAATGTLFQFDSDSIIQKYLYSRHSAASLVVAASSAPAADADLKMNDGQWLLETLLEGKIPVAHIDTKPDIVFDVAGRYFIQVEFDAKTSALQHTALYTLTVREGENILYSSAVRTIAHGGQHYHTSHAFLLDVPANADLRISIQSTNVNPDTLEDVFIERKIQKM